MKWNLIVFCWQWIWEKEKKKDLGMKWEKDVIEHVKVKRPIKLIRLRRKKPCCIHFHQSSFSPAASLPTHALFVCADIRICMCVCVCVCVCVSLKDNAREGHGGGSRSTSAIEPFGDRDCYSAADLPTTQQLIAAIICKIAARATSSSIRSV